MASNRDWNNRQDVLRAAIEAKETGDQEGFAAFTARLDELAPEGRSFDDMNDVRSAYVEAKLLGDPEQERFKAQLDKLEAIANNPTTGMSVSDKMWAGAGASLAQTARGIGQLTGLTSQEEVDEAATAEAPLLDTWSGAGGNVLGHAAQIILPASAAVKYASAVPKVAAAGRAALAPATVAGGAALGAAQAGIQPVATGESRAMNAGVGALGGAGGVVVPRVIGKAARATIPAFNRWLQERAAARVIGELAQNPAAVQRSLATQPNAGVIIPGSKPTLAEMTGDVGLAGAQRTMQSMSPEFNNQVTVQGLQNNAARLSALRGAFGGADETSAQAAEAARNQAATPLLRAAQQRVGVETQRVIDLADKLILNRDKRPAVQASIQRVRDLLVDGDQPVTDVRRLINVRQSIGDMLAGSAGGEADAARAATRELLSLRTAMDSQIRKASPEYADWLRTFREGSREADRIRIGQELASRASPIANSLGDASLSPDKFARAAQDMDAVARKVTGFRKAKAENILTQQQQQIVAEVRRDLERFANVGREGKAVGSNTVQNVTGAGNIQSLTGPVAAGVLTGDPTSAFAVAGLNMLRRKYGEATFAVVQEAMADPVRAAQILAKLPRGQRKEVTQLIGPAIMRQMPIATAAASAAAAAPMDIGTVSGYDRNDPRYRGD